MKRKSLMLLGLLVIVAGCLFWLHGGGRLAKKSAAPSASATAGSAATNNGLAAAAKAGPGLLTGTNRLAFRLANTPKSLKQLLRDPHAILLQNALIDTSVGLGGLNIPENLKAKGDPGAYIVQARGPTSPAFRAALEGAGARIVSYIPNNAYLVQISSAGAGGLSANALVQAVLPYQPYYKLQPILLALARADTTLPPGIALTVGLFDASAIPQITQAGYVTVGTSEPSPFGMILHVLPPLNRPLTKLAAFPGVQAIELGYQRQPANDLARTNLGISTDTVTNANWLNLSGKNVTVEVNDSGIDDTHPDFSATGSAEAPGGVPPSRVTGDFASSLADISGHGTHVAGIIAGNGSESYTVMTPQGSITNADFRGKAPAANLYSVGGVFGGDSDQYLQELPALTNALISNNSWVYGGDAEYDLAAASYDAATRDALPTVPGSQPVLFVFAAGDDGDGASDGSGGVADTILSPGTAKNVITVGALEQLRGLTNIVTSVIDGQTNSGAIWQPESDSSSQVADYSARGNVGVNTEGTFGRFKPDVVAPGSWVVSTRSQQWDTNAYYNPTNISTTVYLDQIVTTNFLNYYSVSVPPNAVSVSITITSNQFSTTFPTNLIIYAQQSGYPDPVNNPGAIDITTMNDMLAIPPSTGGAITGIQAIQNNGFDFAVGDSTNISFNYDLTVAIATTNSSDSDEEQVLQGLDNNLAPWYRFATGTSMSAPAVSGVLALIQDYFTNTLNTTPSPALLKAMLINGSRAVANYTYALTNGNNFMGWGEPNIQDVLPLTASNNLNSIVTTPNVPMFFVDQSSANALATGQRHTYLVTINTNSVAENLPLQATLVWTDPPGDPSAAIKLVNGLELIITNLDTGDVFIGNDIDADLGYNLPSATNAPPNIDTVNNVENIFVPPLLAGNYSVTVLGRDVNVNAVTEQTTNVVQDYALVVSIGEGEAPNAISSVTDQGITSDLTGDQDITYIASTNSPLFNQFVGANTPFQGTNLLGLGSNTLWSSTGALTVGMTNQWHFYVVTNNAVDANGQTFDVTNAAFITFDASDLSVPRMGVYEEADPANATRPEADIDLYATTDPGLINLNPVTLSNCLAGANNSGSSLGQGGTEFVYFTNSHPGQVYYIGVKSEDQMGSEYDFLPIFTATPFSSLQPNGDQLVNGLLLPAPIPDGSPSKPGVTNVFALAIYPMQIENVIVTNLNQHQNFGDLIGALIFGGSTAILNNHDGFGNTFNTNIPFVYDDSPDPLPGTRQADGPGNLLQFQGKSALGPWILNEVDNSLGFTGQVSQFSLLIQPHRNLQFPGIIVAIPPGGWFVDYVAVPPGYTNLTFYATNLPPLITPPLRMYEKFGQAPTLTSFDFEAGLTNTLVPGGDPGNDISIGPPLDIGNYFVGVYNPSTTTSANVFIAANLGFDQAISDNFTYTASGPQPILPDAVTAANPIFVSATQFIESVNVGMVVNTPQISDMTFTLVSPTGQRILLMENRGADSTNGAGNTFIYTNIINSTAAGGFAANTNYLTVSSLGEAVPITYNFYTVPDEMTVYEGTNPANFYPPNNSNPDFLLDTGLTNNLNGPVTITVNSQPGFTNITIIMNQFGNPFDTGGGDAWIYTAGAPNTNYEYLTFTDDTNLSNVPIKFAVPPFSFSPTNPPNYALGNFDLATNGLYRAPTNIYDANGGWSVPTGIVTYATVLNPTNSQLQNVTNVLVLTNNFVSVVTDPSDAVGDNVGTNILALARGTITRSIPTIPGDIYNITFWYRGPGIASWWRGEGNASDSSDPENNGNNGALVGIFNFPAGEVDQAFQFENSGSEFLFAGTNAYVQARQSTSLDVGKAGGFTVEGWINPTNLAQPQPVIEWLAGVPTNSAVTNLVIKAGPYLDLATSHYYYLLGPTDWITSEQWAEDLGGHLATISTANLQNWVFDNFAGSGGFNRNLWIGYTNNAGLNYGWISGETNVTYTNWLSGQPDNQCGGANYTGILGNTNAQPGLWVLASDNGILCNGVNPGATNVFYGVAEVNAIQTNGVQFWISATNTPGTTNAPFAFTNGCLYANIVDTNFISHEIYSPPGLLTNNVFQHVALTYDTNSGLAILYLNGTNVATTNLGVFVPKTDGDVLLGHDLSPNTNNYYGGLMDEMSIYRRALSPAEILSIYQVSTFTTNRTIGKFDPSVTPAYGLAEALVSFGTTSNLLFGVNNQWQLNSYTFTATTNSMPLTISGLEPGILLDDFQVEQAPLTNLYYLPEQSLSALTGSSAYGNWTLQVWDNLSGSLVTNLSELLSWQLSIVLQSNALFAASLSPQTPTPSTIPAGQTVYYQVDVPSWAHFATNILVSSTLPVNLFFNPTNPPTGSNPGDQTLLNLSNGGVSPAVAVNTNAPYLPLQAGSTYYLAVQNPNTSPAQIVLQVNFDITSLTNGGPYSTAFGTNDSVRYFEYTVDSNAYEATFQLLKLSGNADLVVSQGVPLPTLTNSAYGSFNAGNLDESIYVLTNSEPVPLAPGNWYLGVIKRDTGPVSYSVLAKELDVTNNNVTNSVTITTLANGVPFNSSMGPGADLTNFFAFTVGSSAVPGVTNYGVMFELYNLTGNGDLTVQTNALPLAPPFFQTSQNRSEYPESILIFTNAALTNINLTYYLGVPSHETNIINYTIVAWVQTNLYFPGFPGANGSGGGAVGAGHVGTVSTVYHVTSLADSGFGTLRDAVSTTNRTVVFDVGGIINLTNQLVITNSYLTIAGQSAPGGGITVAGNMTSVTNNHDVIIRDVRFRRGAPDDSLQLLSVSNVVADHISAEWTSDNLVSVLNSSNVTVQWSMLAQSLYVPTNPVAIGSLLRYGNGDLSFNHNLYADNYNGSPRLGDNLSLDFVNNVVYDWGTNAGFSTNDIIDNPNGFTNYLNYDCNYLIASSNSVMNKIAFFGGSTNTWIFQTNNFIDSNTNGILDGANTKWNMFTNQFTEDGHAFPLIPVPTDEAYLAYEKVLDFAGVDLSQRDLFDAGIVANVRNQTGTLITTPPLSGIVAWYKGENNSLDAIGTNNATLSAGTVSYAPVEVGQGFSFNGGANRLNAADSPSLNFGPGKDFSIECWINANPNDPPAAQGVMTIVDKRTLPSALQCQGYEFSLLNDRLNLRISDNPAGNGNGWSGGPVVQDNTLHHVAVTVQRNSTTGGNFYVDGALVYTFDPTGVPGDLTCTNLMRIGNHPDPTRQCYFNGLMDELTIYKRALSSNEIASIYNAGAAGKFGWYSNSLAKPYLDTDQDGIPDFWEITFGQPPYIPSNNNASSNLLGYTTLEEYNSWLAAPHAVTVTTNPVSVDLQGMFGQTGHLSFFVTNGVHGVVYLTNVLGSFTNTSTFSNSIAVFTPTNAPFAATNYTGFASFDAYVTNNDTVAYFGPVTVSVVVSPFAPATNYNIPPVITPLALAAADRSASASAFTATNYGGSDFYVFDVTNLGTMPPVAVLFTITNATGPVDFVADYGGTNYLGGPLPSLSSYDYISTNSWTTSENILIASNTAPIAITNGYWYLGVVNVSGSNVEYNINAQELFSVLPPLFLSPTNGNVFTNVETFPFSATCTAMDLDNPPLPLTFALASGPTNMIVTPGGVITWTPTLEQGPTTNGPSTNTIAISVANGDYYVTNTFTIIVLGTNIPPTLPIQPSQVVIVPNGTLVVTNTGTNPNLPDYPLTYTLLNPPFGAVIDTNGIITWMPTLAQAGSNYVITTVVTDTNPWAVNATSLSATNSFTVDVTTGLIVGSPQTNTVPPGGINWIAVPVPDNAIVATNTLLFATNLPVNLWFSTDVPPTITNPGDVELLTNASSGSCILFTNGAPAFVPGGVYFLGVQNPNALSVTYALNVNFDFVATHGPRTNGIPFAGIIHTNIGGTNGYLLTWFAPSNDLFTVQWTTNLVPANWISFTNTVGYNPNFPATPTRAQFNYFDDGSQDGGLALNHFYRLILQAGGILFNTLTLPPQPNIVVGTQTAITITNTATDSNPYAVLTYSLLTAPGGAGISTNGIITWTTPATGNPSTNTFTTVVTDDGVPAASATNTFLVVVEPAPTITSEQLTTNGLLLTWFAPSNELFQVEWRTNLLSGPWTLFTNIVSFNPAAFTSPGHTQFNFLDDGSQSGPFTIPHFYRLILLTSPINLNPPAPVITSVAVSTNGPLLTWFAPSNELFQVQWRTNLLSGPWTFFTNIVSYNPAAFTSPGHTQFNFLDNGSQSGPFTIPHFYRLVLLTGTINLNPPAPLITSVAVAANGTTLQWLAPTNEQFKVQWTTNLFPPVLWTPFTNIIGSGSGAFSFTDTNAALLMKFYELLLLP